MSTNNTTASASASFLKRHKEKSEFNQYWYSTHTIDAVLNEIEKCLLPNHDSTNTAESTAESPASQLYDCAFLSTPSIHLSLKNQQLFENSLLLDYDEKSFKRRCKKAHFVKYDFNEDPSETIPKEYHHKFRYIVVDPPFITRDVWEKYTKAIQLLSLENGAETKVLCSTIQENQAMMKELLNCEPVPFKPSIPNLVYQYFFYTNYAPEGALSERNEEIPED